VLGEPHHIADRRLYLDGRSCALRVDALGSALRLQLDQGDDGAALAPVLCPFRRIERIQCWGPVWWSADALAQCGSRGVVVAFHIGHGTWSYVVPHAPPARALGAMLDAAMFNRGFLPALEEWEAQQCAHWTQNAHERLHRHKSPRAIAGQAGIARRFAPFFEAWVQSELARQSVPAAYLGPSSHRPNVSKVFRRILGPSLLPLIYRLAEFYATRPRVDRADAEKHYRGARWFDGEAPALRARFAILWNSFERLVKDAAEGGDLWAG
jgi:hypothetical protein